MGGILTAYLLTTGIIVYRWATGPHEAPPPGALLGAGVIYSLSGLLAQADTRLGNAVAWAFTAGAIVAPQTPIGPTGSKLAGIPPSVTPSGGLDVAPGRTLTAPGPI